MQNLAEQYDRQQSHPVVYQRVGGLVELPGLLRDFGCDPEQVLAQAGVDGQALSHVDRKLPYAQVTRLLHVCATQTGCPHFGLLAGQRWSLSHVGALGQAMKASPTVGDALETFVAHQHRNSDAAAAFLIGQGASASLGYVVFRKDIDHLELAYDAAMGFGWNILGELCGTGWNATEVIFARTQPTDLLPYRRHFGVPLRFDRDHCAVRFPKRWLDRPVVATDTDGVDVRAVPPVDPEDEDLVHHAYRQLRLLLLEGKHSGDHLANRLSVHRRTLNRRLKDHGTTFQRILDDVRYEVARQLLANTRMPIPDIAAALCYSEVSAFTHAFRRWTATSPHRWRMGLREP